MTGQEVRDEIINSGVRLWQVADILGVTDSTFSRKLRHDFSEEEVEQVRTAIEKIKTETD